MFVGGWLRIIMMTSTLVLALFIGLVYPAYFVLTHKKTNNQIKIDERFKLADYKRTIFIFWTTTILILINSFYDQGLDLNLYPVFNIVGIVLSVLVILFILFQLKQLVVTYETAPAVRERLGEVYDYLPKTKIELNWFILLSISAGICEEIIFRVFLFSVLVQDAGLIVAFVLTNITFALTHIGSGKQNLLSSFILGLLFTSIYYFTNNIWIVVVLHTAIDINAGVLGYRIKLAGADSVAKNLNIID